jgi:broad specificity phosphatase PhoE
MPRMIVLVRHLPTEHDLNHVYTDWRDDPPLAPIEETSLRRVREELATFISRFSVEQIWVSDNPRGEKTVKMLFSQNVSPCVIRKDARLNNIRQPEWAGRSQTEISQSGLYRDWHLKPTMTTFADGESLRDVTLRIESFLTDIRAERMIILSHTTPMQVLLCHLLGIAYDRIWSFKFDHLAFTLIYSSILLRYNNPTLCDISLEDLKLPPHEKT